MKYLGIIFVLFLAFPYTQIIPLDSYTQPNFLVVGSLIFLLTFKFIKYIPFQDRLALSGLAAIGCMLFFISCYPYGNPQEYKYLLNYLAPLVLTTAAIQMLKNYKNLMVFSLQFSICVWFFVSAVQSLFNPGFMTTLLGSWGVSAFDIASSGRGVLGFAPEPTHHAFHILILGACLALLDSSRRSTILVVLCIIEAIVWAKSSSAAMALGMAFLVYLALLKPLLGSVFAGCVVLSFSSAQVLLSLVLPESSRMYNLLSEAIQQPANILLIDYSVNVRLGGFLATFIDVLDNFFLPRGMSHDVWGEASTSILAKHEWLLDLSQTGPPSGIGVLAFQGGILVLPFIFLMFYRILGVRVVGGIRKIVIISTFFIFLGQYYLSASGFALLYACSIYQANRSTRKFTHQLPHDDQLIISSIKNTPNET
tara:strand:- start:14722 stop:15990 length:1269 start_codon:yes stop_codon:yes gene_type:complete